MVSTYHDNNNSNSILILKKGTNVLVHTRGSPFFGIFFLYTTVFMHLFNCHIMYSVKETYGKCNIK